MNRYPVKPMLRWLNGILFCLLAAGCGTFDITARVQVDAVPTSTSVGMAEAPSTATPIPVVPTSVPIDFPTPIPTQLPTAVPPTSGSAPLTATDVQAVFIQADTAPIYAGPGVEYEQIGELFGGLVFPIQGVSSDGAWWQLADCYDRHNRPAAACWIPADPSITQPSDPIPHTQPAAASAADPPTLGSGSGLWVLEPIAPAQFGFGGVFPAPPTVEECSTSPHLSGTSEAIAPMASMYVCYQTGDGRFGYLHFLDVDESATRLTLAWNTFLSDGPGGAEQMPYTNPEFGLSLSLPPTWEGYEATVTETSSGGNICFTFTGSLPICVLQIDIYTQDGWQNLGSVPDGYYIVENANYVFAAGPYGTECVQLDAFQCERYQEIPQVLSTLQIDAPR